MDYDFEKLAREITAQRVMELSNVQDAAAEIAAKIIVSSVQSTREKQAPADSVQAVCRGVMSGLLLIGKELPGPAVSILDKTAQLAQELNLDPQEMMTACMAGIADAASLAAPEVAYAINIAIEARFMGAGQVFEGLCQQAKARRPAA